MTALHPENDASPDPSTPPPGCPAHGLAQDSATGPDGTTRLYGPAAESDPMGLYGELRTLYGGVAPVLLTGDVPAWLVLGYQENMDVMRTPQRFTRDTRGWRDLPKLPLDSPLMPMLAPRDDCLSLEGAEHQRLRSAVADSLGKYDGRGVRRHILRYANRLIDEFCQAGQADLVEQYIGRLPILVVAHLFGVPEEAAPRLVEAISGMFSNAENAVECNEFVLGTMRALVERKREEPGYDLTSWLIEHPAGMNDEEVVQHLRAMLMAGHEPTMILMTNTLRMVLTDARFRASLTGGLMTVPDAVEQVLWDEPPLIVIPGRVATSDTELAGHRIAEGDLLVLGAAAGNVDPYIRPDLSAPVHGNRSHLAFGRGSHECPGQDIGRAIAEIAVDTLLVRLPDVRLAVEEDQLSWTASTWTRHLDALPVLYTPKAPAPKSSAARKAPAASADAPATADTPVAAADAATAAPAAGYPAQPATDPSAPVAAPRQGWWRRLVAWLGLR